MPEMSPTFLAPGFRIRGRYEIERVLGTGGMATVYLGRHVEIGASLAIKVLHPALAADADATEHFLNEARAVSRIQHPHIVAVSDYGRLGDGVPYMVMEYLNGEDLQTVLDQEGPLPWPRARSIALQICEALGAAHLQGVIHRDVKPQNCFRQSHAQFGDFIKVLDFGIADVFEDVQLAAGEDAPATLAGTPDFIAPEVGGDGAIDHRADIYSLGVTLFVLVTGRRPFESDDPLEQLEQHRHRTPPRPSDVGPEGLDPRIDQAILRAMAKRPADRYPNMGSFAEAIERIDPEGEHASESTETTTPENPTDGSEVDASVSSHDAVLPASRLRSDARYVAAGILAGFVGGVVGFTWTGADGSGTDAPSIGGAIGEAVGEAVGEATVEATLVSQPAAVDPAASRATPPPRSPAADRAPTPAAPDPGSPDDAASPDPASSHATDGRADAGSPEQAARSSASRDASTPPPRDRSRSPGSMAPTRKSRPATTKSSSPPTSSPLPEPTHEKDMGGPIRNPYE